MKNRNAMKSVNEASSSVVPSAIPSEGEIAAWQTLPRDEQLRRLQAVLTHPDCSAPSAATMDDIRERARSSSPNERG